MDAVVFQLHGTMASWGKQPAGTVRHVDAFPGRSNLLGLLGAALGIDRNDDVGFSELGKSVRFAIKIWEPGTATQDFQTCTTTKPGRYDRYNSRKEFLATNKNHTMVTRRDYRSSGYWQVAVIFDEGSEIEADTINQALVEPHYPLFLGRKSCIPSLPLAPRVVEGAKGVGDVFVQARPRLPDAMSTLAREGTPVVLFWEGEGEDITPDSTEQFFDGVKSVRKRLFRSNTFNTAIVGN